MESTEERTKQKPALRKPQHAENCSKYALLHSSHTYNMEKNHPLNAFRFLYANWKGPIIRKILISKISVEGIKFSQNSWATTLITAQNSDESN